MGWRDGGEDVRTFQRACADGRVTPAPSLLLRSAMAEARTVGDAAGNQKLSKGTQGGRRHRARDDAAAAAILAVSAGVRLPVVVRPAGGIGARPRATPPPARPNAAPPRSVASCGGPDGIPCTTPGGWPGRAGPRPCAAPPRGRPRAAPPSHKEHTASRRGRAPPAHHSPHF